MADDIYTFGRDAVRDIADTVRAVRNSGLGGGLRSRSLDISAVPFRIAKTTTNADYPSYPTSGDTFVVELGELSWTEATGTQTNTWTAYSPQDTRLAHDITGKFWPQNSYVYVALHHGRWHIIGGASVTLAARVYSAGSVASGNTCQAELGSVTYTETVGRQTMTFTADSPQSLIYVHEMNGPPFRVNDLLFVQSINGKYYCVKTKAKTRLKAQIIESLGIAPMGSGLVRIVQSNAFTQRTETAYWNWMMGNQTLTNLPYGLDVIIEWFDDEQQWTIVQSECEVSPNYGP